ncbi:TonB-dependent receptor [Vibrio parahaemolyticus]|uniref:TonB-dependent receptor n=1 Tax=Vibrio parahaemolyticus TaxID=670 RepID=UPI000425CF23|nr:TonB-dependent receptor [Vibrio parahaemolyticus]EGR3300328.1 TonB-dependent receptor [Vibrio parahaemolyticus]EGR3316501.1 TonB-dependent receptor [Vibrio parahaemolyticus]EMA7642662.1 TonB-dependent receptor [Vibrio parahaemolyticus]KHF09741.1 TonB-dependent receptor [Vibrio parahaemolyticus]TOM01575.1 TonB-dependent receptor [Vibrio parahaemolyticus]
MYKNTTALSVAISLALGTATAFAPVAAQAEEQQVEKLQKMKVTGSRISRVDMEGSEPVQILSSDYIENTGLVSIGDVLNQLPGVGGTVQSTSVNNGSNGAATVNLRGLSSTRTLVLVNGRRMVNGGTGADSSVDLNMIPTAMVERIEVLKNGASSVYGSDAIAGVVNIITKQGYDGFEVNVKSGRTSKSDGEVTDISLLAGSSSDRGNITFSAGYTTEKEISSGDRGFSNTDLMHDGIGGSYVGGSSATPWGYYDGKTYGPENSDTLRDFTGDDLYNYAPDNYLKRPAEKMYLAAQGNYLVTENEYVGPVNASFEALYSNSQSDYLLAPEPIFGYFNGYDAISKDNEYNTTGEDIVDWRRRMVETNGRNRYFESDTARFVLALDGEFSNGWMWDTSFNWGKTKTVQREDNVFMKDRVNNAIGASANGQCLDSAGQVIDGCVPMDMFGGVSQAALDYATFTRQDTGYNQQQSIDFNVSGDVFEHEMGTIAFAAGYQTRREKGENLPDALVVSGNASGNAESATSGSYTVDSFYGELLLPILSDVTLADYLEAKVSARHDKYSSFGGASTYGYSFLYQPVEDIMFRGSYSDVFRAPSISALYGGAAESFDTLTDPTGQDTSGRSQFPVFYGSNDELKPEEGHTASLGFVFAPSFVDGVSATVDYWQIELENLIDSVDPQLMLNQCNTDGQYCDKIVRDAQGNISSIDARLTNLGKLETNGIDFNIRYLNDFDFATLLVNWENTYTFKYDVTQSDGSIEEYNGKFISSQIGNYSSYRSNLTLGLAKDSWKANWNARLIDGVEYELPGENGEIYNFNVPTVVYHDISAAYMFDNDITLSGGINNLFDKEPPLILDTIAGNTDTTTYDVAGRYFYVNLNVKY